MDYIKDMNQNGLGAAGTTTTTTTTTVREKFETVDFVEKVVHFVRSLYSAENLLTGIYREYADRLESVKESVAHSWNANLQAAVTKAQDNGINLLESLKQDDIIAVLNIPNNVPNAREWLNNNFSNTLVRMNNHIGTLVTGMVDNVAALDQKIQNSVDAKLAEYSLVQNELPSAEALATLISSTKRDIVEGYKNFVGNAFDQYFPMFYNKVGYDEDQKINDLINSPTTTALLVDAFKAKATNSVGALSVKTGMTSRDVAKMIYDAEISTHSVSLAVLDANFMPGIQALVSTLTTPTQIMNLGDPRIELTTTDPVLKEVVLTIKLDFTVSGNSVTTSSIVRVPLYEYTLPKISSITQAFTRSVPQFTFISERPLPNGVITKQQILDSTAQIEGNAEWNQFFTDLENVISPGTNSRYELSVITKSGKQYIIVKVIDDNIHAGDFDAGGPSLNAQSEYWTNMRETVSHDTELLGDQGTGLFENKGVVIEPIEIKYMSELDELIDNLKKDTKEQDPGKVVPLSEIQNPDLTFKSITDAFMQRYFHKWQDFLNLEGTVGATHTLNVASASQDGMGDSFIDVNIDYHGVSQTVKVKIKTINENEFLTKIKENIEKFDNSWEDTTPSVPLNPNQDPAVPDSLFGSFKVGATPTISNLTALFPGLETVIGTSTLNNLGVSATVKPVEINSAQSKMSLEMILSWNSAALSLLKITEADLSSDPTSIPVIGAVNTFLGTVAREQGVNLMVPIQVDGPTGSITSTVRVAHFLTDSQRIVQNEAFKMFVSEMKTIIEKVLDDNHVIGSFRQKYINEFNEEKAKMIQQSQQILKMDDAGTLARVDIPDWELRNYTAIYAHFAELLKKWKDEIPDIQMNKSQEFKIILTTIASITGLTSLASLFLPLKMIRGSKKQQELTGEPRSYSKTLIKLSVFAGIASAFSTLGIMLYVFISQGGL